MKRKDGIMFIVKTLGELDVLYPDGYGYETQAEYSLKKMEEKGFQPPCVPKEISRALTRRFVYPVYNQWDEDAEESLK